MFKILIPKNPSNRETKRGGGPFWKKFWTEKIQSDRQYYFQIYNDRKQALASSINKFSNQYSDAEKTYYAEIKLDEMASSKSKEPHQLWLEAGLEVVQSRKEEDNTYLTVSGKSQDFAQLNAIAESSNFENAELGRGKEQILARQVFAVTELYDQNATIKNRTSVSLHKLIEENYTEKLDCIITVYYDRNLSEYEALFRELQEIIPQENIHLRDTVFFVSNMSYRAVVSIDQIKALLQNEKFSFIAKISINPTFIVQRTTPNINLMATSIGNLLTDEKVVLIDSGVDNPIINPLITYRKNYLNSGEIENQRHGTNVASKILFGHNFFKEIQEGKEISPSGKIIDVQVLHQNTGSLAPSVDTDVLMRAIKENVNRFDVTIYNLSITSHTPINDHDRVEDITVLIDSLSNEKDLLFLIAAGNQTGNYPLDYLDIFNTGDHTCNISAPADALNALTVGAISEIADNESICDIKGYPAPFTRKGGIRKDIKKPELVAYGGNVKKDPSGHYNDAHLSASSNKYGVDVMVENGFDRVTGTSLSTPLVTREAMIVLNYLKKSNLSQRISTFDHNKANLVKAILIHSTSQIEQAKIQDHELKRAYGFGRPEGNSALFDNDENSVTIVYADSVSFSEKRQKLLIKLPEYLLGMSVEFKFTLVYNPPVNPNFKEYKMIDLSGSIGLIFPEIKNGSPTGKTETQTLAPSHTWNNYKSKSFNTIHYKRTVRKLEYRDMKVGIEMTVSNHLINTMSEDDIKQNYAVIISIKDKSEQNRLRSELLQLDELSELIENRIRT